LQVQEIEGDKEIIPLSAAEIEDNTEQVKLANIA
jgi:hypothetical protein